jgi:hypothetical protein
VFAPIIPLSALLAILAATSRLMHKNVVFCRCARFWAADSGIGDPDCVLVSGLNVERVIIADQISYLFSVLLAVYFVRVLLPFVFDKSGAAII